MTALGLPAANFADYATSTASAMVVISQPVSGFGTESSDPYLEWALQFDNGLKRLDERLRGWLRSSASLADDDIVPPSAETVSGAIGLIGRLKVLVMDRVAPSNAVLLNLRGASIGGGGEISIELAAGPYAVTYCIEPDGTITELRFRNSQLVHRVKIPR